MKFALVSTVVLLSFSCIISASSNPSQQINLSKEEANSLGFSIRLDREGDITEVQLHYPHVINGNWFPYLGGWSLHDDSNTTLVSFSADLAAKKVGTMTINVNSSLGEHGAWILYKCKPTKALKCNQMWPKGYMFNNLETWE